MDFMDFTDFMDFMNSFGLLGFPLGHSFSKSYFTEKFRTEQIEAEFLNFELEDITRMTQIIRETPDLKGFAITIPYKEKIIPFLDHISEEARAIGAVNSVKVERTLSGFSLTGYNTDMPGFRDSLLRFMPYLPKQALVLGTGGAAKAVKYALTSLGISVTSVSRTPSGQEIGYPELTFQLDKYPLIVNTTPLGMSPHTENCPPIPYEQLSPDHYLFDLVYNPAVTTFMQRGIQQGAKVRNGLEMLHLQAEYSWQIWNA